MNKKTLEIMIVDDHPILREGLAQLLEQQDNMHVVAQAPSAEDGLKLFANASIDFIIVDISLKGMNGIDLVKLLRKENPNLWILVLSMHDENLYAQRALRAGANGYIMKNEHPSQIVLAINSIVKEGIYLSQNISSRILKGLVEGYSSAAKSEWDSLSDREIEVLRFIGEGLSSKEIGHKLGLSPKTIDTHRENLKKKLNINERKELLQKAIHFVHSLGNDPMDDGENS